MLTRLLRRPLRPLILFVLALALLFALVPSILGRGGDPEVAVHPSPRPVAQHGGGSGLVDSRAEPALPGPADRPQPPVPPPDLVLAPWAPPPAFYGAPAPPVSAAHAVVMDEASGAVLFAKAADRRAHPASLTKIATAVIALREGNLDAQVTSDVDYHNLRGSSVMGLLPGDVFTLRDLLYGLMLPSGNDSAIVIGRHLAGADDLFVVKMNELARRMGLTQTQFANPHGLTSRQHYTTALDLAVLSRYAMSVPGFQHLALSRDWIAYGARPLAFQNLNSLLGVYPGADGIKIGYTGRAGQTMVASATRNGHRVYVVLLNAPQRDADAIALLDWAFANHGWPPAPG